MTFLQVLSFPSCENERLQKLHSGPNSESLFSSSCVSFFSSFFAAFVFLPFCFSLPPSSPSFLEPPEDSELDDESESLDSLSSSALAAPPEKFKVQSEWLQRTAMLMLIHMTIYYYIWLFFPSIKIIRYKKSNLRRSTRKSQEAPSEKAITLAVPKPTMPCHSLIISLLLVISIISFALDFLNWLNKNHCIVLCRHGLKTLRTDTTRRTRYNTSYRHDVMDPNNTKPAAPCSSPLAEQRDSFSLIWSWAFLIPCLARARVPFTSHIFNILF